MAKDSICAVSGCGQLAKSRGWCRKHYLRWLRNGGPTIRKPHPRQVNGPAAHQFIDAAIRSQSDECLEWPFSTFYNGYPRAPSSILGSYRVHRILCTLVHGEAPSSKHQAAHNCGNRKCVNPNHLRWATVSENLADRTIHGTAPRGTRNPHAKLSEKDVHAIRALRGKQTNKQIAKHFGVSITAIANILTGQKWGWLESQPEAGSEI